MNKATREDLATKNRAIMDLGQAKAANNDHGVRHYAAKAALLEGHIAEYWLQQQHEENAAISLVSRASCLIDTGRESEAIRVLKRALDLEIKAKLKTWIEDEISRLVERGGPSLRREYEEHLLQRIEEYKEALSRRELLSLGDEAIRDLDAGKDGSLILTEVLMLDHVDRIVTKRLRLPLFRRWRETQIKRRQAQMEPAYWDLSRHDPVTELVQRVTGNDLVLAIGQSTVRSAFFVAAHGAPVVHLDDDIARVEAAESRAANEFLGSRFQSIVVSLGGWIPDVSTSLVLMDIEFLAHLDSADHSRVITILKDRTTFGGTHLGKAKSADKVEQLLDHYGDWPQGRIVEGPNEFWLLTTKPKRESPQQSRRKIV